MQTVDTHEVEPHLSRLVEKAPHGDSFIIINGQGLIVEVVAIDAEPVKAPQRLSFMKWKMRVPDNFDTMYAKEIEDLFYNDGKL